MRVLIIFEEKLIFHIELFDFSVFYSCLYWLFNWFFLQMFNIRTMEIYGLNEVFVIYYWKPSHSQNCFMIPTIFIFYLKTTRRYISFKEKKKNSIKTIFG